MKTIFAGFSPFPGAPYNPSGDLIEMLTQRPAPSAEVYPVLLPVDWDKSWQILREAIERERPETVVLFGLHITAERLRLELLAQNRRELGRKDASGGFPAGPSILEGPPKYESRLPWAELAALLRSEGIDFEWSSDAGAYLCNDTFYRLAHNAENLGVRHYGFIHIPMSDERVGDFAAGNASIPPVFNSISAEKLLRFAHGLGALFGARSELIG
ncbi:hypothetical protein [Fulvimarina sp. MAC8]|uniref:pyroglutamyl-peptidase I family protein n=1 Tax=Fulvimarina sp. MAC8 TaxID=3162874 RepID=UPI0032EEF178